MHGNLLGVLYSVLLILVSTLLSLLFKRLCKAPFSNAVARKIIHIGVSNWYFIYLHCFDTWTFPVAGLLSFALINFYIEFRQRKHGVFSLSWGTVEYPLVVSTMVVLVYFGIGTKEALGSALLAMGYGDGLAAIMGNIFGKTKMPALKDKTVLGSLICFAVSTSAVFLVMSCPWYTALTIGLCATLTEAYTPFNLDNITMPLVVFVLAMVLC